MSAGLRAHNIAQMPDRSTSFDWISSKNGTATVEHSITRVLADGWKRDTRAAALSFVFAGQFVSVLTPFMGNPVEHRVIQRGRPQASQNDSNLSVIPGALKYQETAIPTSVEEHSAVEALLNNLGRLKNGWMGEGSLAPTAAVLRDMESISSMIDRFACPDAEVDAEDGTVRLAWDREQGSFSLVFNGRGKVVGVLTPHKNGYPPWSLSVEDELQLSEKLASDHIADFICA